MKNKLTAIKQILTCRSFSLVTSSDARITVLTDSRADLTESMVLAVAVKRTYDEMAKEIERQAIENGEVQTLQSIRDTIAQVEDYLEVHNVGN